MQRKMCPAVIAVAGILLGLAVLAGCASSATPGQVIKDISTGDAAALIQENRGNAAFAILDVRTADEFASGHLEGAANLDFYQPTFRDELAKLDRSKTYLVYCRTGNRSAQARDMMKELDFIEVYNMSGGIVQWQKEARPLVK